MPFTTINDFTNELVSWTNSGISTAVASNMITLAEDRLYRELRVRQMEPSTAVTMVSGQVPVPSDMIEVKDARIDSSPEQALQRKSPDWIYTKYPDRSGSGIPKFFAREGSNFIFGPPPSSDFVVRLNYYARPSTAVSGTLTGIVSSSPGLLLNAAMVEAEAYLGRDNRVALWESKYQQLKELVMKEDRQERFSGSPLTVTTA